MPMPDPVVILGAARTPLGSFQGELMPLTAPQLGACAIAAALERCGGAPDDVSEVTMGCVLPAGLGQAPARQAAIGAGLPKSVPCTTVNKMCGSGMMAAMIAHDGLVARPEGLQVAGGMESMSNAPYLLPKARAGLRLGHGEVVDHMFLDGLEDAYDKGRLMGTFAEDAAEAYQFTRQAQDAYAAASLARALAAAEGQATETEITPVATTTRKGTSTITHDEQPRKADPARIPLLRPAFREGGTVTAANSSSISDGAAALVLSRESFAEQRGIAPLARVVATSRYAGEPALFTSAPVEAIRRVLDASGWRLGDVDLFEVNEAFAVVPMIAMRELSIPIEVMNVNGGACALGHPIGASGARILVTLVAALRQRGARRGIAAICIGGGEATAVAIEMLL
ncbi:MAG: acetyl-CoA C-acyltransferase [Aurantimonas endophytica]|uniref:Acetyl-CoA C-acetyltransferase n=1 Tax=Aurantimonas endophytica TaxID=1522175 RepID=A0A7W6MQZ1_9HYPH|nr:acetyl-CoA C-acyltransferase [Aurantimonas endophytica]MBB4004490.1 acetyl-CoA C-acetyltransferase [Aurantimonas endophytica]